MVQEKTNIAMKKHLNQIFNVSEIYISIFGTPKLARRVDNILDKTFYKFLWNNGPDRVRRKHITKKCEG